MQYFFYLLYNHNKTLSCTFCLVSYPVSPVCLVHSYTVNMKAVKVVQKQLGTPVFRVVSRNEETDPPCFGLGSTETLMLWIPFCHFH